MIQGCIPGIQEILSKVRTFSECCTEGFYDAIHFEYNEDDFSMRSMNYSMESFDLLSDIYKQIQAKKRDFAYLIQDRYIERHNKEKEKTNMAYTVNVDINNPLNLFTYQTNAINAVATSYKAITSKESDKGLAVTAAKQPKDSTRQFNVLDILSKIKDYKIYNGKALVVWFTDGSFTKAVVSDGEEFDFYTGLMVCLFKKYFGENGSKKFNKMMEVAMKKLGDIDKNKEKQAEEKALAEKKRRKADMKRKAKALKKKEEAIDIQKQGFVRAMQEIGEDDRK